MARAMRLSYFGDSIAPTSCSGYTVHTRLHNLYRAWHDDCYIQQNIDIYAHSNCDSIGTRMFLYLFTVDQSRRPIRSWRCTIKKHDRADCIYRYENLKKKPIFPPPVCAVTC